MTSVSEPFRILIWCDMIIEVKVEALGWAVVALLGVVTPTSMVLWMILSSSHVLKDWINNSRLRMKCL